MQGAALPATHASLSPPHPTSAAHRSTSAGHRPTPLSPTSPPRATSFSTPSAVASAHDAAHTTHAAHGDTQEGTHSGTTHSGATHSGTTTHSGTPGDERYYTYGECRTSVERDLGVIISGCGPQRDLGATWPPDATQEAAPQVPPPLPRDRSAGYHPTSSAEDTPVYIGWGGATGGPASLLRGGRDSRGTTQGGPPVPAASPRVTRPATAPAEGARPEPTGAKVILHQEVRRARTPSPDLTLTLTLTLALT